jgi:hypothetical protein
MTDKITTSAAELAAAPEIYERDTYFAMVRASEFAGTMNQGQVDGQNAILARWEADPTTIDHRWLAYALATTKHETASTMLPIEEYGKGSGSSYGKKDQETGQTYYGRGFVQLTWRENYAKADKELKLTGDKSCEWHAGNALNPLIAADIMFFGMRDGWFRGDDKGRQTFARYFNETVNDPFGAREIINGDKMKVPSWSGGKNIGNLIAGYHFNFLEALKASYKEPPPPVVEIEPSTVDMDIFISTGVKVIIKINGNSVYNATT